MELDDLVPAGAPRVVLPPVVVLVATVAPLRLQELVVPPLLALPLLLRLLVLLLEPAVDAQL